MFEPSCWTRFSSAQASKDLHPALGSRQTLVDRLGSLLVTAAEPRVTHFVLGLNVVSSQVLTSDSCRIWRICPGATQSRPLNGTEVCDWLLLATLPIGALAKPIHVPASLQLQQSLAHTRFPAFPSPSIASAPLTVNYKDKRLFLDRRVRLSLPTATAPFAVSTCSLEAWTKAAAVPQNLPIHGAVPERRILEPRPGAAIVLRHF